MKKVTKRKFDLENDDNGGIPFADTLLQFVGVLVVLIVIIVSSAVFEKSKQTSDAKPIGSVCVELSWPQRDIDLDLWGHSPTDNVTVGYSNMHGKNLQLLRDIVGFNRNPSHVMLEIMCSNEAEHGEWVFNVHYFENHETNPPDMRVDAMLLVTVLNAGGSTVFTKAYKFTMDAPKQEKTVVRFIIDSEGLVDLNSINHDYIRLTNGWKNNK